MDLMKFIAQTAETLIDEKNMKMQLQEKLKIELAELPKGKLRPRKTGGKKTYYYHEWYCEKSKKCRSKYVPMERVVNLQAGLDKRNQMEDDIEMLVNDVQIIDQVLKPLQKHLNQKSAIANLKTASAEQPPTQAQSPETPPKKETVIT